MPAVSSTLPAHSRDGDAVVDHRLDHQMHDIGQRLVAIARQVQHREDHLADAGLDLRPERGDLRQQCRRIKSAVLRAGLLGRTWRTFLIQILSLDGGTLVRLGDVRVDARYRLRVATCAADPNVLVHSGALEVLISSLSGGSERLARATRTRPVIFGILMWQRWPGLQRCRRVGIAPEENAGFATRGCALPNLEWPRAADRPGTHRCAIVGDRTACATPRAHAARAAPARTTSRAQSIASRPFGPA